MTARGDIVSLEIPYYDQPGSKERPAVVIQCDRNNGRLLSTLRIKKTLGHPSDPLKRNLDDCLKASLELP